MLANYHTHTWRCGHAEGAEEEYVNRAIQRGMEILGFSDHCPYPFPDGYISGFRMRSEQLEGYASTIFGLRDQHGDKIQILLGVEAEYYPAYFPELLPMLRDAGVTYMLLGQHYTNNEVDGWYSGRITSSGETLVRYCDQAIAGLETGLFSYVAHPDLLNFHGSGRFYEEQMGRICRCARGCGLPLELNLLGLRERRHYPNRRFWEVAAREGCSAVLGCDAHTPQAISDTQTERTAMAWMRELGIPVLAAIPLRPIE